MHLARAGARAGSIAVGALHDDPDGAGALALSAFLVSLVGRAAWLISSSGEADDVRHLRRPVGSMRLRASYDDSVFDLPAPPPREYYQPQPVEVPHHDSPGRPGAPSATHLDDHTGMPPMAFAST
ncbi:MAG: hypothetical protein ACYDGR_03295 [Candidatus Dormibacteria bacterium]